MGRTLHSLIQQKKTRVADDDVTLEWESRRNGKGIVRFLSLSFLSFSRFSPANLALDTIGKQLNIQLEYMPYGESLSSVIRTQKALEKAKETDSRES